MKAPLFLKIFISILIFLGLTNTLLPILDLLSSKGIIPYFRQLPFEQAIKIATISIPMGLFYITAGFGLILKIPDARIFISIFFVMIFCVATYKQASNYELITKTNYLRESQREEIKRNSFIFVSVIALLTGGATYYVNSKGIRAYLKSQNSNQSE